MLVQILGQTLKESQVGADIDFVFANSAAVNFQASAIVAQPDSSDYEYEFILYNPSLVTDMTLKLFQTELTLKAATRQALVATLNFPKSQSVTGTTVSTYAKFAQKIFNGTALLIVASNDTVLGVGDGFTATLRIREVG